VVAFQASLFDAVEDTRVGPLSPRRTVLGDGAWIDVQRRWIAGADPLFERLRDAVPWRAESRPMYDRVVDVPRLLAFYAEDDPLPDPALLDAKARLDTYYRAELGERFATAGLCLYRYGRDSVAWHGDRLRRQPTNGAGGRGHTEDTMVAIVSLGDPRALMLRPRGGGPSLKYEVGHGDLLVMGGSCQRTWEHAVPKTAKPVGPRISVQFRTRGVQ
jgi:alkylated DNA repair dioxygenase AlkB